MSVLDTLELCFQANLNGVDGALSALSNQLQTLSASAESTKKRFSKAGRDMMAAMAKSVSGSGGQVRQAADRVMRSIRTDGARSAGVRLASGFAAGIRSGQGAVGAAAMLLANTALKKLRSALQIHSPSKVTTELGANFGAGFAGGILDSLDDTLRAAETLSRAAAGSLGSVRLPERDFHQSMTQAVQGAMGNVNLTIPLNVDGMKLGEASIRGINAVTRSAGRVLINI